jgi:hypothetical protein
MVSTKSELASVLETTPGEIDYVISRLDRFYRFRSEPKPNGGERVFYVPHGRLRKVQDKIKNRILVRLPSPLTFTGG